MSSLQRSSTRDASPLTLLKNSVYWCSGIMKVILRLYIQTPVELYTVCGTCLSVSVCVCIYIYVCVLLICLSVCVDGGGDRGSSGSGFLSQSVRGASALGERTRWTTRGKREFDGDAVQ